MVLQFDYRERAHAVGKMPRSRTQKEFSNSDREVAVSALMDRAFKPLFPPGFSRFCQVRLDTALLPAQLGDAYHFSDRCGPWGSVASARWALPVGP